MSDHGESRKRIIIALLLLAAAGGLIYWNFARQQPALNDETATKVADLQAILDDAQKERAAQEADVPPAPVDPNGPTDMRSGSD